MSKRSTAKNDPDFQKLLKEQMILNFETGQIKTRNLYVSSYYNIQYKGSIITLPQSHLSFFLSKGRWPKEDLVVDHINDDPLDNRPENLQELTHKENQFKRRGRIVSRAYGQTKYGHGITISQDKRDNRWYAFRIPSRGETKLNRSIKITIGGADTVEELEKKIKYYVEVGFDLEKLNQKYPIVTKYRTKYGHGISISKRKRDGTYKVSRRDKDTKLYIYLGGFPSLGEAEKYVENYVKNINNENDLSDLLDNLE